MNRIGRGRGTGPLSCLSAVLIVSCAPTLPVSMASWIIDDNPIRRNLVFLQCTGIYYICNTHARQTRARRELATSLHPAPTAIPMVPCAPVNNPTGT